VGFAQPAVVVTSQDMLDKAAAVVHVVPLTTTLRRFGFEVVLEPDEPKGLAARSAVQCHQIRTIAAGLLDQSVGNVGAVDLTLIRATIGLILEAPTL
jgi:mRNA-degrading endonuclease toxin of MazEF toxin-antitoxin module